MDNLKPKVLQSILNTMLSPLTILFLCLGFQAKEAALVIPLFLIYFKKKGLMYIFNLEVTFTLIYTC